MTLLQVCTVVSRCSSIVQDFGAVLFLLNRGYFHSKLHLGCFRQRGSLFCDYLAYSGCVETVLLFCAIRLYGQFFYLFLILCLFPLFTIYDTLDSLRVAKPSDFDLV